RLGERFRRGLGRSLHGLRRRGLLLRRLLGRFLGLGLRRRGAFGRGLRLGLGLCSLGLGVRFRRGRRLRLGRGLGVDLLGGRLGGGRGVRRRRGLGRRLRRFGRGGRLRRRLCGRGGGLGGLNRLGRLLLGRRFTPGRGGLFGRRLGRGLGRGLAQSGLLLGHVFSFTPPARPRPRRPAAPWRRRVRPFSCRAWPCWGC